MFKIAFINPPRNSKDIASAAPPINLATLAAYIRSNIKNINIKIIDGLIKNTVRDEIVKFNPDLICITSTTPTIEEAYKIADFSRNMFSIKVIIGGVHVSVLPEEALKHADIVIVGEGEIALLEIINKIICGETINEKIIERNYIINLDDIPAPAWDLIDMEFYINSPDNSARTMGYSTPNARAITILTSRGCPYKCIFCHNSWRSTPLRYHSAKRVVKDLEHLIKEYNIDSFVMMNF